MAVDMFLKIANVKGESSDKGHAAEIDVLAWNWGMSQSGTTHTGAGGGAGKVNVQDITFSKWVDKATPVLMKLCCAGEHLPDATLVVRKAGGKPLEYLKIKMKDVLVANIATGGNSADDRLTETLTLNFGQFEVEYVPQKPDGSGDASIPMKWNISTNSES